MKRVAADAHLPTPWLIEPTQTIEPTTAWTAVTSLSAKTRYSFFHFLGPMSIPSELGHLAMPINFLA